MNKSLKLHKQELETLQLAQKAKLKEQLGDTKKVTITVAKLALIGGASAYIGIKAVGFVGGKIFGKKKEKHEPQIIYVKSPEDKSSKVISPESFGKGLKASLLAALFPLLTSFAKKAGTKAIETYSEGLFEKYKYKLKDLIK